jgi:hypothetical protein
MTNHPNRTPRHGHLPGHIRDTFGQAIDAYTNSKPGAPLPLVQYEIRYRERMISIAEACRLVWNCTDVLPGSNFDQLRDCLREPPGSQTYAAAARALLRELQESGQADAAADIARRRLYDARDAAWRELEGWILAENGGSNSSDRGERFLMRGQVHIAATKAVEQWRERAQRVPATNLEQLLERVAAAEDAIDAAQKS